MPTQTRTRTTPNLDLDATLGPTPVQAPATTSTTPPSQPQRPGTTLDQDAARQRTAAVDINDPRLDDFWDKLQQIDTSQEPSTPTAAATDVEPQQPPDISDLPAVINRSVMAATGVSPEWIQVKDLPGYMSQAVRTLGRQIFGVFTTTPIEEIQVLASLMGQGPSTRRELNAVAGTVASKGRQHTQAEAQMQDLMPGYEANINIYTYQGYEFLVMKDDFGDYIYSWPSNTQPQKTLPAFTESVNDIFDLLPAEQQAAKRQEVADRSGQAAWDIYHSQSEELARRVKLLAQDPKVAYQYARYVLRQPWHQVKEIDAATAGQAHQSIASNGEWAYWYALEVLEQPWHQVKEIDTATAHQAHQSIASNSGWAHDYALDVLRQPWHQVKEIDAGLAHQAEQLIANSEWAYLYVRYVLRQPWHQAPGIDPATARQAHQSIVSNDELAYLYARYMLRQPWHQVKEIDAATAHQAHQSIASNGEWAYNYASYVLGQPWHQAPGIDSATAGQADQSIASSGWARNYAQHFGLDYDAATKTFRSKKPK